MLAQNGHETPQAWSEKQLHVSLTKGQRAILVQVSKHTSSPLGRRKTIVFIKSLGVGGSRAYHSLDGLTVLMKEGVHILDLCVTQSTFVSDSLRF